MPVLLVYFVGNNEVGVQGIGSRRNRKCVFSQVDFLKCNCKKKKEICELLVSGRKEQWQVSC